MAFSSSWGYILVAAWLIGCIMVHMMVGGVVEAGCSSCQLLPLLMFELPILVVSIPLSPTLVLTVSGVTNSDSNQVGFLPH